MTTEEEINEAHRQRFEAAASEHGGKDKIPSDVVTALQEEHRQAWVNFTNEQKGIPADGEAKEKRSEKQEGIEAFLDSITSAVGSGNFVVTADMLAGAGTCTKATARKYIDDHPQRFRASEVKGEWIVLDPAVERAVELAAVPDTPAELDG